MRTVDLHKISTLMYSYAGININADKRTLIENRISKRMEEVSIDNVSDYLTYVESNTHEKEAFINALTTNLTDFFREPHHFERLNKYLEQFKNKNETIRIWSSGCSTGKEPYSAVTSMLHSHPWLNQADFRVLATDIDTEVLEKAKEGKYPSDDCSNIPPALLGTYFIEEGMSVRVTDQVKKHIVFNPLNIHGRWPISTKFDAIFFRNVSIYFKPEDLRKIFKRYANALKPGGLLFLGHSEILHGVDEFEYVGNTTYQRL